MKRITFLVALAIFTLSSLSTSMPPDYFQLLPYDFTANFLKPYLVTPKKECTLDEIKLACAYYRCCRFPGDPARYQNQIRCFLRNININESLMCKPIDLPDPREESYFNIIFLNSVLTDNRIMATIALSAGADIEYQHHYREKVSCIDKSNYTPLCHAAAYGYTALVELLLKHGADPNGHKAIVKTNPLICALNGNTRNTKAIVKLLLEAGAKPNIRDAFGQTPLSFIASYSHFKNARTARELLEKYRLTRKI